jgi:hypothetical protein
VTEATARYVIAADDRTKSAISSIKRGFSDLDASAKTVGKTLKGLATGAAFYGLARGVQTLFRNAAASSSTFNDSLESVKKSFRDLTTPKTGIPAATKALDELAKTLSDPQVKSGADQLFSFLIKSAATLAEWTAKTVSNLAVIGKGVGLVKGERQDEIDRLIVEIAKRREGKSALARGFGAAFGGVGGEDEAVVLESLEKRLYDLQQAQRVADTRQGRIAAGVRGGRDRGDGFDIKPVTEAPLGPLNLSLNARAAELTSSLKMEDFGDDLIESTAGIADQMSEIFKQPFEELSPYADEAARNMQTAFADFLFDPFEDGIKGMLRGFVDVLRRMVAEAAAAKIFGSKKSGGLGLGDLVTGAVGSLFGFAQGGSFNVGGSGGTDSQLVAFKATPGERVSVSTPEQQKSGRSIVVHQSVTVNAAQLTQDQAARMVADSQRMMWDELDRRYGLA